MYGLNGASCLDGGRPGHSGRGTLGFLLDELIVRVAVATLPGPQPDRQVFRKRPGRITSLPTI